MTAAGQTDVATQMRPAEAAPPLARLLVGTRVIALLAILLITLAWPTPSRTGELVWPLVVALAAYYVLVEILRRTVSPFQSFAWIPYVDLPVASVLYYLYGEPGGPFFVSFYVAVVTAAASLTFRAALVYAAVVAGVVLLIAPTLPAWVGGGEQIRTMSVRALVLGFIGVGTAVLARRLAHEEEVAQSVRLEAERLSELDRLRREFLSTVSHDLRTPLTAARAALGMVATTAAERLLPEERQLVDNARRNIERLGLLIDDLLAFNQLGAGTLQLDQEPCDVRRVVDDSLDALQPLFHDKRQQVSVDLPEALPAMVDAKRLEQAITNLLANAHLHTPAGTQISITGQRGSSGVLLQIADNGPGIPSDHLDLIFRRFHRSAPTGGSGLGLAIARGLVELHGGRLWAESRSQTGVTFLLTLPCAAIVPVEGALPQQTPARDVPASSEPRQGRAATHPEGGVGTTQVIDTASSSETVSARVNEASPMPSRWSRE